MTRLAYKLKEKLKRLGIEYDFKGYVEVAKEDGIVVSSLRNVSRHCLSTSHQQGRIRLIS